MKFTEYLRPKTVAEALALAQAPETVILGGTTWLRMQKRAVRAVDLSDLGLDKIEETERGIRIGAYVTLREAETSARLNAYAKGTVKTAFSPIVGVQFRNGATVGGSVYGRFGFSDVETLFTALGAKVCLAGAGEMPMEDFIRNGAPHDVLTHILLPKAPPDAVAVAAHRLTATDFPTVTVALVKRGNTLRVTVSPAPTRGVTADLDGANLGENMQQFFTNLKFGDSASGSAAYKAHLCEVLVRRALAELGGQKGEN